jgi:hypothetical protein
MKLPAREAGRRRARVLKAVAKLPGAVAVECGTHLSLEVRGKRFGWYLEDHHGDGRLAVHLRAPPGADRMLASAAPAMFHVPAHVGHRGWIGLWLDLPEVDWPEVEAALGDAYQMTAPKAPRPSDHSKGRTRRRKARGSSASGP